MTNEQIVEWMRERGMDVPSTYAYADPSGQVQVGVQKRKKPHAFIVSESDYRLRLEKRLEDEAWRASAGSASLEPMVFVTRRRTGWDCELGEDCDHVDYLASVCGCEDKASALMAAIEKAEARNAETGG